MPCTCGQVRTNPSAVTTPSAASGRTRVKLGVVALEGERDLLVLLAPERAGRVHEPPSAPHAARGAPRGSRAGAAGGRRTRPGSMRQRRSGPRRSAPELRARRVDEGAVHLERPAAPPRPRSGRSRPRPRARLARRAGRAAPGPGPWRERGPRRRRPLRAGASSRPRPRTRRAPTRRARAPTSAPSELAPLVLDLDEPLAGEREPVDVRARRGSTTRRRGASRPGRVATPSRRAARAASSRVAAEQVRAKADRAGEVQRVRERGRASARRARRVAARASPGSEARSARSRGGGRAGGSAPGGERPRAARRRPRPARSRTRPPRSRRGGASSTAELDTQTAAPEADAEERFGDGRALGAGRPGARAQDPRDDALRGSAGEDLREGQVEGRRDAGEAFPDDVAEPRFGRPLHPLTVRQREVARQAE